MLQGRKSNSISLLTGAMAETYHVTEANRKKIVDDPVKQTLSRPIVTLFKLWHFSNKSYQSPHFWKVLQSIRVPIIIMIRLLPAPSH